MQLTSIIVDDENNNINLLNDLIINNVSENITVVATSNNFFDAISKINKLKPQILFLDVRLDRGTAFDLLKEIDNYYYIVVFVTAFEEYAKMAFEYNTSFYILKPVTKNQVIEATKSTVQRFIQNKNAALHNIKSFFRKNHFTPYGSFVEVFLENDSATKFSHLRDEDILFFKSQGDKTLISVKNDLQLLSVKSLGYFEKALPTDTFVKIHKEYMVNLNNVKKVIKSGGDYCEFANGVKIPISNNYSSIFYSTLHLK